MPASEPGPRAPTAPAAARVAPAVCDPLRVLVFLEYYLPGAKSGGPVRTVANMVARLTPRIAFDIVTRDRDFDDEQPYTGVRRGQWQDIAGARVRYVGPDDCSLRSFRRLIRSTPHDVLYLNSLFSPRFTTAPLLLHRLRLVGDAPVILAPRGEFSRAALARKAYKKRPFFAVARRLGLYRGLIWQASTEYEAADIRRAVGSRARILVARDLSPVTTPDAPPTTVRAKRPGQLRVIFMSRINSLKNIDHALRTMIPLRGEVEFDLYGTLDDPAYWKRCQEVLPRLPPHVRVTYHGFVPHEKVPALLQGHDLFYLPTHGENYGHAIHEALLAGRPVLISDRTLWRGLEAARAGWDLPLEEPRRFTEVLQRCVDMDAAALQEWADGARRFGERHASDGAVVEENLELFRRAAATGR